MAFDPLNLDVEPLNFDVEPLNFDVEPFNLNVDPLNLDVEPFNLEVAPFNLEVAPFNLKVAPFNPKRLCNCSIIDFTIGCMKAIAATKVVSTPPDLQKQLSQSNDVLIKENLYNQANLWYETLEV